MKRVILFFAVLFITACSTDNQLDVVVSSEELVEVSIIAGNGDDAETDSTDESTRVQTVGNRVTWEVGDKLAVAFSNGSTSKYATFEITDSSQILGDGKSARFTGSVAAGSYTEVAVLYHVADNVKDDMFVSTHASKRIYMDGTATYSAGDPLVVTSGTEISLPVSLKHLMHKIDYKLTVANGYTTDALEKSNIAIEMIIKSSGSAVDMMQCGSYSMTAKELSQLQPSKSHVTPVHNHDFTAEPVVSSFVFPMTVSDAELTFNVYIDGKREYEIHKGPLSTLTMSAGRTTVVNLALSEQNKVVEEAGGSDVIVSNFAPDFYISSWMANDGASLIWGIGYRAYVNDTYIDIHVASDYATDSSITEGDYEWKGTSFMENDLKHFSVKNNAGLANLGLKNSITLNSGTMKVTRSGSSYIIDITLTDVNNKTIKLQYIGELNVRDGGQSGSTGEVSGTRDITLVELSSGAYESSCGSYLFSAADASGSTIDIHLNADAATNSSINVGTYEYTSKQYAGATGLFHADNIIIRGSKMGAPMWGIMQVTKGGNELEFSIYLTFDDGTEQRYIYSGTMDDPIDETLTIRASQSSIVASGSDYVYFTAVQGGYDVTSDCTFYVNGSAIYGSGYASTTPGTYTVYAIKDGQTSNELTITVEEYVQKAITISASKTSIVANGVDSATLTVTEEGGKDVTSSCTFYVNGGTLSGSTFRTTSSGDYSIYAMYNGVKSNTITISATQSTGTGKTIVFADGVTISSGWYDVNKKGRGESIGDGNMCWAAAASNMIQWWQDRYVEAGHTLPATAVTGTGTKTHDGFGTYELALMDVFYDNWDNSVGGHTEQAIPWYFEGTINEGSIANQGSQAVPLSGGGYWKNEWSSIYEHLYHEYSVIVVPGITEWKGLYTNCFHSSSGWDDQYSYHTPVTGLEAHSKFSQRVQEFIGRGICSLTVTPSAQGGIMHATTIWGYEVDNSTGLVTRLWITDSDDLETEPKQQLLNEYNVTTLSGSKFVKMEGNTRYGAIYAVDIRPFSKYGSKND